MQLHKKSILAKTLHLAISTFLSKLLGIVREIIQVRYLGVGGLSDAFNMAFQIPNTMRKMFAEGALSAAFVPTLIQVAHTENDEYASRLMTTTLVTIGTIVSILCAICFFFPQYVILLYAPGFAHKPEELAAAQTFLRILIFFILFISASALFSGALQAKNKFGLMGWSPFLLNIFYVGGLVLCGFYNLSVTTFCFFLVFGAAFLLGLNIYMYYQAGFRLLLPDNKTYKYFKQIMRKFIPSFLSYGALEVGFLIDGGFASLLAPGVITLVKLAFRFNGIALGAFAVAFSSILLSHFSHISVRAHRRLSFYLLESAKFMLWVTIPVSLFMSFFAYDIFYTIFYKIAERFTLEQVAQAGYLLTAFVSALFFYSLNKLFLTLFYSLHQTFLPTIITCIGAAVNYTLNYLLLEPLGAVALAVSTAGAAVIQSILFLAILHSRYKFKLYIGSFVEFLIQYLVQLSITSVLFYGIYRGIVALIMAWHIEAYALETILLWVWVGPLFLGYMGMLYMLKRVMKTKLYFLD